MSDTNENYMKIKRRIKFSIIYVLLMMIFTGCESKVQFDKPEIRASFLISQLSDEDFVNIGSKGVAKEDFRKVDFTLKVKNCNGITNRKISVPKLDDIIKSYSAERYWYGQNSISDSEGTDAEYSYNIMFYGKGLTKKEITSIFSNEKIIVTWEDKKGKEENCTIYLDDLLIYD